MYVVCEHCILFSDVVLIGKEKTRYIRSIKAHSNESQLQSSFIMLHHSHFDVQFILLQNRNSNSDSNRSKQTITHTHTPSSIDCNNDSSVARLQYLISECYGHHFEFLNGKESQIIFPYCISCISSGESWFCAPLLFTEGKKKK